MRALFLAFALAGVPVANAQIPSLLPGIDRLAAEPGAQVTRGPGRSIQAVELSRNGVVIRATRRNGQVEVVGSDGSGLGALLCAWGLYREIRVTLSICERPEYRNLQRSLDGGLTAMNAFIAANSLVPVTAEALASSIVAHEAATRARMRSLAPSQIAQGCQGFLAQMGVPAMAQRSARAWQDEFARLLSVPRPPVLNPCL